MKRLSYIFAKVKGNLSWKTNTIYKFFQQKIFVKPDNILPKPMQLPK